MTTFIRAALRRIFKSVEASKAKSALCCLLVGALVAGCAGPQLQTREDWLAATSRTYRDVAKDDILRAGEHLFRLADGTDFTIVHQQDALIASRQWMVYLVIAVGFGTDHWVVRAQEARDGAIQVTVSASTQSQMAGPSQPTLSGGTPSMGPTFGSPVTNPALYRLFWARMDYLLGVSDKWLTCDDASSVYQVSRASNGMELLCNPLNVNDDKPTGPLITRNAPRVVPSTSITSSPARQGTSGAVEQVERKSSTPAPIGQFVYYVERLARSEKCSESPIASLTARGPGFENYTVACVNGDALSIRCDLGECRVLR
jgi:hypothetical protein